MKDFEILVHLKSLEVLPNSGKRREAVLEFIRSLKNYVHVESDFQVTDKGTGRIFEGNNIAGFSVIWWVDGPDKEVKIVSIRSTD